MEMEGMVRDETGRDGNETEGKGKANEGKG